MRHGPHVSFGRCSPRRIVTRNGSPTTPTRSHAVGRSYSRSPRWACFLIVRRVAGGVTDGSPLATRDHAARRHGDRHCGRVVGRPLRSRARLHETGTSPVTGSLCTSLLCRLGCSSPGAPRRRLAGLASAGRIDCVSRRAFSASSHCHAVAFNYPSQARSPRRPGSPRSRLTPTPDDHVLQQLTRFRTDRRRRMRSAARFAPIRRRRAARHALRRLLPAVRAAAPMSKSKPVDDPDARSNWPRCFTTAPDSMCGSANPPKSRAA